MKAVVYQRYGSPDVLELRDVERPVLKEDRFLVRVRAVSLNRSDWEALTARPFYVRLGGVGFFRPKNSILGSDVAGTVEAVGSSVTQFRPGDEVLGDLLYSGTGGFAEYVSVPERAPVVLKPAGLTFEQAAAIPQAAMLALQGLRYKRQIQPGHKVLINGAGGGAGTIAVQIAKSIGSDVTAVDHTAKLEMMRSIGADHVIDYTSENFANDGPRYDRILDFVGRRSMLAHMRVLRPDGIYVMLGGSMPRLLQTAVIGSLISKMASRQMGVLVARPDKDDLLHLAGLVEAGEITPVMDQRQGLGEVPEALRDLGMGRVVGKVVIAL